MATVIINSSTPEPFSAATPAAKSTSSLAMAGNWFFYSNNPETVQASHLADSGRYLNRVYVTGEGQLYTWHANGTGSTIKNCILIHNPDPNNSIKVTATNYGLTHSVGYTSPDTNAWLDFWGSSMANPITVTVGPNGYGNIFLRDISSNAASFGIIARLKITDLSGNPKSAYLYDLAYISNSGGAHSIASTDGTQRRRGVANTGYWAEINFAALAPTNEHGLYYLLAAPGDTFNGTDMPYINDPGGTVSGPLEGNYGQQIQITLPIRNSSTTEDFNLNFESNLF
jgi:hypothetical protein